MSSFTKARLLVSPRTDGKNWTVERDFTWYVTTDPSPRYVNVLQGFNTDFDSTPWLAQVFAWAFLRGKDRGRKAHTLHDWGYRVNAVSRGYKDSISEGDTKMVRKPRKWWDQQYKEALIAEGVPKSTATKMYYAVRIGGKLTFLLRERDYDNETIKNTVARLTGDSSTC